MRLTAAATVLALGVWVVACVGDDPVTSSGPQPDPNVPIGQFRGACTSDGKCIEGLVCTQGVCLQRDGAGTPVTDGGGSASDTGPGADAAVPPCEYHNTYSGPLKCSSVTCSTGPCCMGSTEPVACDPGCSSASSPKLFACDTSTQCASGTSPTCCVRIKAAIDTGACPHPVPWSDFAESVCTGTCGGVNEYLACRQDSDCDGLGKKCNGVELANAADKITFGICL